MSVLNIVCECGSKLPIAERNFIRGGKGKCPHCSTKIPMSSEVYSRYVGKTLSLSEYLAAIGTTPVPVANPSPVPIPVPALQQNCVWRVGQVIEDRYEVKRLLGEGTFGSVWLVWDRNQQMDLAVKELRADKELTPTRRQNFLRESRAWILELGSHPSIVTAWWILELDQTPRLFLEYCSGGSLDSWIDQNQNADPMTVIDMGIQLMWGLAYCHSKKIIHRDFKPLNILVTATGEVKITDFGTVKFAASDLLDEGAEPTEIHDLRKTIGGVRQGTPPYMPPEQWDKGIDVSPQADIYAFGVTLYKMLTGAYPIQPIGSSISDWIMAHSVNPIPSVRTRRPDIPQELDELIQYCLAKSPSQRPQSAKQVADQLIRIYQQKKGSEYPRQEPNEAEALADRLNNQAVSLMAMGDPTTARSKWEQALTVDPVHLQTTLNLSVIRWRNAEIDDLEVIRLCKQAIAASGESLESATALALVHLERGDVPAAEECLKEYAKGATRYTSQADTILEQVAEAMRKYQPPRTFANGYSSTINSVSLSSNGKLALLGNGDSTVTCWDVGTGKCLGVFQGHTHTVRSVVLGGDGKLALSGSEDKTLKLWDVNTGNCLRIFQEHTDSVNSVSLSKDAKLALSGSSDRTLKLWDVNTGNCLRTFQQSGWVYSVVLSGDGKLVLAESGNSLKLWDVETGKILRTFEGHSDWVTSVVLSGDGKLALSGSSDKTLKLWDVNTGQCIRTFGGHTGGVTSVSLSRDGTRGLSGSVDRTVKLWDIFRGQVIRTFQGQFEHRPLGVLFEDGRSAIFTTVNNSVRSSPTEARTDQAKTDFLARPDDTEVRRLQSRCADLLRQAEQIIFTEPQNAKQIVHQARAIPGCSRRIDCLGIWRELYSFVPKSKLLQLYQVKLFNVQCYLSVIIIDRDCSVILDGRSKVWDVETGQLMHTFREHLRNISCGIWSADKKLVLTGTCDNTLGLWDATSGQILRNFEGHTKEIKSVSLRRDGKFALSGGHDKTFMLWDVTTASCIQIFQGHRDEVTVVAFADSGKLALSASADRTLRLWDLATGQVVQTFFRHASTVTSASLDAVGKLILSGSADKTLKLWDTKTGTCLRTLYGHQSVINSVCLSQDGRLAISGSDDKTVRIWDTKTGQCLFTLEGHPAPVVSVQISEDSGRLISASSDGTIIVWFLDWELDDN